MDDRHKRETRSLRGWYNRVVDADGEKALEHGLGLHLEALPSNHPLWGRPVSVEVPSGFLRCDPSEGLASIAWATVQATVEGKEVTLVPYGDDGRWCWCTDDGEVLLFHGGVELAPFATATEAVAGLRSACGGAVMVVDDDAAVFDAAQEG